MKIFILLLLGSLAMAAKIDHINIGGVEVPLIFEEDKRLPIFNLQLVFRNSGTLSDDTKAGLARFSAKVLNEGTLTRGSSGFAKELESRAISLSAQTGRETLVLDLSSLKEQQDEALGFLGELLNDPNLSEASFKKVQTILLGEVSRRESDFDYIASNELRALLFKGTPLAYKSTKESINSIELSDVVTKLNSLLVRSKLIIAVGGDVNLAELKPKLVELLSTLKEGSNGECIEYRASSQKKDSIIKKESEQAYIYFGSPYNTHINSPDLYKAKVASFILGAGGFGSRLMEEIRVKKGLAYSAYARLEASKSATYLGGHLQTKLDSADEAKRSVKEVLEEFVKNGATADELEQTKKFMLGSEPLRVETMNQRLSRAFMEYYNDQGENYAQRELEKIQKLTLDELNSFIKTHNEVLDLSFAIVTK
ncbi:MAG: pitrilysin family protein [Sulfuricurvum sp.]